MTLVALAPLAGAVEGDSDTHVSDIRIGLGFGPLPEKNAGTITDFPSAPGFVGTEDSTTFESSPGLAVTLGGVVGTLSPVGLLIGGELRYVNGTQQVEEMTDENGVRTRQQIANNAGDVVPDMSYSQFGVAGLAGLGFAVTRSVHLEILALAGLDWVTADLLANRNGPNLQTQNGTGPGYTLGGRLGAYWTDEETSWQFGVEGEWMQTRSELKTSYLDATTESTVINRGISVRAVLGHRF